MNQLPVGEVNAITPNFAVLLPEQFAGFRTLSNSASIPHAPPHAIDEDERCYTILFNLLGVDVQDVAIDFDDERRELTVTARKDNLAYQRGFFWTFAIPADALIAESEARMSQGVLEISIPKLQPDLIAFDTAIGA
jgi:HSP20 family molecular chaperone IbpA